MKLNWQKGTEEVQFESISDGHDILMKNSALSAKLDLMKNVVN